MGDEKKKMMMQKLVFAVNGERFDLSIIDPSTTLLEFLRTKTRYTGTKLGCGEGGCGACVVLLAKYNPVKDLVEEFTVSSCLTLLCSINGCSITTTEGLGNSKDGFHSIHQRFAGFHASQCGFCTPGMCMSLFSSLVNADKMERPDPTPGFSKITVSEAEQVISGNLCRCTGYRPIVDVCKSFAADVDIEDLGLNSFWSKGENADILSNRLPFYTPDAICTFPDFLKDEIKSSMDCLLNLPPKNLDDIGSGNGDLRECHWYTPASVEELQNLLKSEEADNGKRVKLVVGNTSAGIYKELDDYHEYINISHIPELLVIQRDTAGVEIGAAVSISKAIHTLMEGEGSQSHVFRKIAEHMNKVASPFVRNTASLGGNLVMAQQHQFPSDIATILIAAGSSLNIHTGHERVNLMLEDFLEKPPCDHRTLVLSIQIPSWNRESETKLLFETYRAAPRPFGNAVAYLNAAFLARVSSSIEMSENTILENPRLAFGAYGTKHATRATMVEKFLNGKVLTAAVLLEAIQILRATIVPEEGTSHYAYRSSLAVGFLFDFLRPFIKGLIEPTVNDLQLKINDVAGNEIPNGNVNGYPNASTEKGFQNGVHCDGYNGSEKQALLFSAKQVVEFSKEYHPVGEPTKKVGAEIQAAGEALYVDDIPSPKDCVHGAFIFSTMPVARVKGIEFKSAAASQRMIAVISAKDIPKEGKNIGSKFLSEEEPLFADDLAQYAGQALGFVIADTQRYANMAAKQAIVNYDTEGLEPPILSVEEAVIRSSFFEIPSVFRPKEIGDFAKGMAEADHKILSAEIKFGSQYYFYMETQTALAIPDEDNCVTVYSSIQNPELEQGIIANCLGIPYHNVRVITRRVGGGFGGKAVRAMPIATACALAAHKLRRPVRTYLDRRTDMIMIGGRHPMKINYTVGFKSDGKVTALHVDILVNAGITEDISPLMPLLIVGSLKKYNWGALSFDAKVCRTNLSSKSSMRSPGEVQGTFIAEAIIEHIASTLSLKADSVREKNMHTFESLKLFYGDSAEEPDSYTMPSVIDKLISSSSFHHRTEMIKQFNGSNKWRKRGISWVPAVYQVGLRPTPGKVSILNDGSIVVEVGGIELGQGLWTKVKQVTAFALSRLWGDGQDLLGRIRVIQADSLSLVQGGITAGSTTSETSCEAVRLACSVLVERLMPLKQSLQEQMAALSWDTLISQAKIQAVNLSSSTLYNPGYQNYLNFGAAVTEVEIDVLTGGTTILRTDIVYDCGRSLNPAVDMGQVEGAFVQGVGFFLLEEYVTNSDGLVLSDGTWTYKIPTVDTIPREFNVELLNSGHHQKRILSSKASGEPPLLLAASVHCAIREAIREARKEFLSCNGGDGSSLTFQLDVPANMPVVKELCGLDNVEKYLENLVSCK